MQKFFEWLAKDIFKLRFPQIPFRAPTARVTVNEEFNLLAKKKLEEEIEYYAMCKNVKKWEIENDKIYSRLTFIRKEKNSNTSFQLFFISFSCLARS